MKINMSKVVPIDQMVGDNQEETRELNELFEEAKRYISSFSWCSRIIESYFGIGVPRIFGVFLFKIIPSRPDVDDWIWVVVGDLPLAYINVDECPNPACALDGYIGAMEEWIQAVKNGKDVSKLIPVDAPANLDNAELLEGRLKFLDEEILAYYRDDLSE